MRRSLAAVLIAFCACASGCSSDAVRHVLSENEAAQLGSGYPGMYVDRTEIAYWTPPVFGDGNLYPFDAESAFTSDVGTWSGEHGHWIYTPREYVGYHVVDNQFQRFGDVQEKARAKYHLAPDKVFLGFIDGRVFYWKAFDPSRLYWREENSQRVYSVRLPSEVIDLYGVTKGTHRDICVCEFQKETGFILFRYAPYAHRGIEISLSEGKLVKEE